MIDHNLTIDRAAIIALVSARPDRIYFPYAETSSVLFHALEMIADHIARSESGESPDTPAGDERFSADCARFTDECSIAAYLVIQPSRQQPRAGLTIIVNTPDGQQLRRTVYSPEASAEAADILTDFLTAGAPGLRDDVRRCYQQQHRTFLRRAILSGGAGLRPEYAEFCQAFASMARAGKTPAQIIRAITA